MGITEKLRKKYGREPTPEELDTARALREAKRAAEAAAAETQDVVVVLHQIASGQKDNLGKYFLVDGPTTARDMLLEHKNGKAVTTYDDIISKATKSFASKRS